MSPTLGLALLLASLLPAKGLLESHFSPAIHEGSRLTGRMAAKELARRNADFGFRLLKKLSANNPGKNIFLSPLSISTAFSMLCLGAEDSTLAEIKKGLNFRKMPERDLHEGFHYLIHNLNRETQDVKMRIGNTLFMDQNFQPQRRFMTEAKNLYSAETISANFQNLEDTQRQINDYVSQKTHGKINNLIKQIDPGTVLLLTNYIFFQARWQHEFHPNATKEEDFILGRNSSVKVPMMSHEAVYTVGRDEERACTILEMPFAQNLTAAFILPDKGKLKRVEASLQADVFAKWKTLLSKRVVRVSVPRLHIRGTLDLKKTLSSLGVTKIFEERGDLTRISPHRSLKVGEAMHEAELIMDEKGTEAAAGSGAQTLPMEAPLHLKINQPFLLMVYHSKLPAFLFLGRVFCPQ
ncbi:serpin A12 [Carlito syrichta]|uniref:Serpin A12 n=1 Tax=Carlito syrichta TaxID=1868482 RepID=A0A1U7SH37_CARSF|nr:serpin A12 [Carlito syrichta]